MNNKLQLGYIAFGIFAIFFFFVWLNPVFVIMPGEKAIIFNVISGLGNKVYSQGLNFKMPFVDQVIVYDSTQQTYEVPLTEAASKDLQPVKIKMTIFFRPMVEKLPEIYKRLGSDKVYKDKIFTSIPKEVIKSIIASKTAEEVITQRAIVSIKIKEELTQRLKDYFMTIEEVSLTEIEFSQSFIDAINRKQVAEQDLETSKRNAQSAIEQARGEAESARIINEASRTSPAFIELRKIEAQKDIAKILSTSSNVIYLPSNTVLMTQAIQNTKQ